MFIKWQVAKSHLHWDGLHKDYRNTVKKDSPAHQEHTASTHPSHKTSSAFWIPRPTLTHCGSGDLFFSFFTVQMTLLRPAFVTALFFCNQIRGSPHPSPCSSEDTSNLGLLGSSTLHIQLYHPAYVTRLKEPVSRAASHSSI